MKPTLGIGKKKSRWKKPVRISALVVLILIVIMGALTLIYKKPAQKVYSECIAGKDLFLRAQDELLSQDFSAAQLTLVDALTHFTAASNEFHKFKWLQFIPWVGTQIKAVDNLLLAGISTGDSIKQVAFTASTIVEPITKHDDISLSELSPEETHQLLENLYNAKPTLENAKQSIDKAVSYVDDIPDKGLIKNIKEAAAPLKDNVPQLQSGLEQAISASQIIPAVVGYPEQKKYLFLLQNNSEMRPSGGFIGTYGILKIKDGDITSFVTDNIYNLDQPSDGWLNVEPPWPLTRYNDTHKWFLRDSNWSPDFPTSAQKALWFYEQERGPEKNFDGVVAVTPTFIQSLIVLTGDIKVNGLTFTSDNFIDTLQYQVDQGYLRQGISDADRKEIIGVLSAKILDDVLSLPKSSWPDLWKVIQKNIEQKQLLVYVNDEYTQNLILKENWGGQIKGVDHDYLSVVDANLASLKTDPHVKRSITYQVRQDGDNLIADLYITYKNDTSLSWSTTRYRTYVRAYVPHGSNLLTFDGAMIDCKIEDKGSVETTEEMDKTAFGTFVCTEPGEERTLHLKYALPSRVSNQADAGSYSLLVQKQAGTASLALTYNFDLNKSISTITGLDTTNIQSNNKLLFTTDLSSDRLVELQLK